MAGTPGNRPPRPRPRLGTICRQGDKGRDTGPPAAWYDRVRNPSDSAALSDWVAAAGDEELANAYEALLAVGYRKSAAPAEWNAAGLITLVARARERLAISLHQPISTPLTPLNPTAS